MAQEPVLHMLLARVAAHPALDETLIDLVVLNIRPDGPDGTATFTPYRGFVALRIHV